MKGFSLDEWAASTLCLANSSCGMSEGIEVRGRRTAKQSCDGFKIRRRLLGDGFPEDGCCSLEVAELAKVAEAPEAAGVTVVSPDDPDELSI